MTSEISKKVRTFYNKTPFPDYELDRFNDKNDLDLSMYPFARIIDRSIPKDASIIDVGCGTGQLTAFLSLRRKSVCGIDFSDSSLNKAKKLKKKLGLNSLCLKKIDILDLEQIKTLPKFDYVLCLGVLHHTGNPHKAFENIVELLKPNGKIAIGLYHQLGRIPLKIRKILAKTIFKNNQKVKDYFIRMQIGDIEDKERARGWWNDQYNHPHESSHMLGEVLKWFKEKNIEYVQAVPPLNPFKKEDLEIAGVWNSANESYPCLPLRMLQLIWLFKTQKEGGYWLTFGRLKN